MSSISPLWRHQSLLRALKIRRIVYFWTILMPISTFNQVYIFLSCKKSYQSTSTVSSYDIIPPPMTSYLLLWHHTSSYDIIPPPSPPMTSYLLLWHHTSSYDIIPPPMTSYLLLWHHTSSYGIIPPPMASYLLLWHHTSSYDIIPPPMTSNLILWHHTSFYDIKPPPMTSYLLLWHHTSSYGIIPPPSPPMKHTLALTLTHLSLSPLPPFLPTHAHKFSLVLLSRTFDVLLNLLICPLLCRH